MDPEIAQFLGFLEESMATILACTEGLGSEQLEWKPGGEGTNCLQVIAAHSMANAERNVLATFCGEPHSYDREAEFMEREESAPQLMERWERLRSRMRSALAARDGSGLTRQCDHVRLGSVPGRTVLLQAARHAAEHVGEARLTRSLLGAERRP